MNRFERGDQRLGAVHHAGPHSAPRQDGQPATVLLFFTGCFCGIKDPLCHSKTHGIRVVVSPRSGLFPSQGGRQELEPTGSHPITFWHDCLRSMLGHILLAVADIAWCVL